MITIRSTMKRLLILLAYYALPMTQASRQSSTDIGTFRNTLSTIHSTSWTSLPLNLPIRGGGMLSGWNPFGYGLTDLGTQFLSFEGSADSDVGRFLATFKSGRKRKKTLKDQWLEIVRVSKSSQSMRIYRLLDDLWQFCIQAGFLI